MAGDRTQAGGDSTAQVTPEKQNATPGDGRSLLEHSGWLDRVKSATSSAVHGAQELGKKGLEKGTELTHQGLEKGREIASNPQVQGIAHDVANEGRNIAKQNVDHAKGVVEAGKHGDVNGVIRNAAPLAEEAALGPHGTAVKIIKDEAVKSIKQHAEQAARDQVHQQISDKQHHSSNTSSSDTLYVPPLQYSTTAPHSKY